MRENNFGQCIGDEVLGWEASKLPVKKSLVGSYCKLEPLQPEVHGEKLFEVLHADNSSWTYLVYGPFDSCDQFMVWLNKIAVESDPLFYAILDKNNNPVGMCSYMRITPQHGVIEIGHIHFSSQLKKTRAATEAMFLMMSYAFDELGYRRYEWKCDALNQSSREAAERLGFQFEGIFRQEKIYKNRNRDTAWYSIIDTEWQTLKLNFQQWLRQENFDVNGKQLSSLSTKK